MSDWCDPTWRDADWNAARRGYTLLTDLSRSRSDLVHQLLAETMALREACQGTRQDSEAIRRKSHILRAVAQEWRR